MVVVEVSEGREGGRGRDSKGKARVRDNQTQNSAELKTREARSTLR